MEIAHDKLIELHVVRSMNERKALTEELSDGFIMLPGGHGSLDEFFEMLTWLQLGLNRKPCGILNKEGFVKAVHRDMILVESSPQVLIQHCLQFQAPSDVKWINAPDLIGVN